MTAQQPDGSNTEPPSVLRLVLMWVLTGIVFAAAGAAISLHTLAERLLPHIVTTTPGIEFQEIVEGRPIPRLLNWSYSQIRLFTELRDMSPWTILIGAVIFGILLFLIISILNPTFRPLSIEIIPSPEQPAIHGDSIGVQPSPDTIGSDQPAGQSNEIESSYRSAAPEIADVRSNGTSHISVDRVHLEQALRVLLVVGLPVLAVWYVTGAFGNNPIIPRGRQTMAALNMPDLVRYLVLGIGIFAAYSQSGLAGQFGILHQAYQSDEAVAPTRSFMNLSACIVLTLKGCLFGVAVWALKLCALAAPGQDMLDRFASLGTFDLAYFSMIARTFVVSAAIVWLSAGTVLFLLGKPGVRIGVRAAIACVPILGALALVGMKMPFSRSAMAARYDATDAVLAAAAHPYDQKRPTASVPMGTAAALEFTHRVPVSVIADKPAPYEDVIAFDPRAIFVSEFDKTTDDGLITDHSKIHDVLDFLEKRKFQSALSWPAMKYLFNDANIRFDQTAEIRFGLDDLEYAPHMINMGDTIRGIFFTCAATAQNLALLNEYADESRFAHPTRDSQRMMGQLYTRFGEVTTALRWYRDADMPRSFIEQVRTEKPLFHTGVVRGKLTWNGAPMAGVQVGAAPQRLNGLPRDMQPAVFHYDEELAGVGREQSPLFSAYHPRPFHLRWISGGTITGADGSFTIDHLTEGEYFLVCTLPDGVKLTVPTDLRLTIQHGPPAFTLSYKFPKQDLGTVVLGVKR